MLGFHPPAFLIEPSLHDPCTLHSGWRLLRHESSLKRLFLSFKVGNGKSTTDLKHSETSSTNWWVLPSTSFKSTQCNQGPSWVLITIGCSLSDDFVHILTLLHHHLAFASVNVYQPCHIMPSSARAARGFLKSNWDSSIKMRPPSIESYWIYGFGDRIQGPKLEKWQQFKDSIHSCLDIYGNLLGGAVSKIPILQKATSSNRPSGHQDGPWGKRLRHLAANDQFFIYIFHYISLFHCICVNFH